MLRNIVANKILNQVLPLAQQQQQQQAKSSPQRIVNLNTRNVNNTPAANAVTWRILVLDPVATHILNWCCTMQQLTDRDITLVEDIEKKRQPTDFEAIYICEPSERNVQMICDDFDPSIGKLYKYGHIFFLTPCEDVLFNRMVRAPCRQFLRNIMEINLSFMPLESRVFQCCFTAANDDRAGGTKKPDHAIRMLRGKRLEMLEKVAEQIATMCSTLKEYPQLRYRRANEVNFVLAQLLQLKLDQLKTDEPEMGQGFEKQYSQLILLDRSVDVKSALIHELSYQAMAYDLLTIDEKGAVVTMLSQSNTNMLIAGAPASAVPSSADMPNNAASSSKAVKNEPSSMSILDENDSKWCTLRHLHIADVLKKLAREYKVFSEQQREARELTSAATGNGAVPNVKKLKYLIKKMPQHQRSLHEYATHLKLTEDCMRSYNERELERLCLAEQSLACGTSSDGEKVKDPMRSLVPILLDSKYTAVEKLRLIGLYILWRCDNTSLLGGNGGSGGGISQDSLDKLIQHAQIPSTLMPMEVLSNLQYLRVEVLELGAPKRLGNFSKRIASAYRRRADTANITLDDDDNDDNINGDAVDAAGARQRARANSVRAQYETARWIPVVKDIMQDAIEGTLSTTEFPYLSGSTTNINNSDQHDGAAAPYIVGSARQRVALDSNGGGNNAAAEQHRPRLMVFVLGGMTYSEMRCAYEVCEQFSNHSHNNNHFSNNIMQPPIRLTARATGWDVLLGSTHVITPQAFVDDLKILGED